MTAEQDIAAIADQGENTAADVRAALTSVLLETPSFEGDRFDLGRFTPPGSSLPAQFTELKADAASTTVRVGVDRRLYYTVGNTSGDKLYGLFVDLPGGGADFDYAFRVESLEGIPSQFQRPVGVCLAEGSNAQAAASLSLSWGEGVALRWETWSAFNTRTGSTAMTNRVPRSNMPMFFRVVKSGSNYNFYTGLNPNRWALQRENQTLGFTPTRFGAVSIPASISDSGFALSWIGDFS